MIVIVGKDWTAGGIFRSNVQWYFSGLCSRVIIGSFFDDIV